VQSIRNKISELELLCCQMDIDVLCVSEHWLLDTEIEYYSSIASLNLVSSFCRRTPWGGVAIYLNNKWESSILDLSDYCDELHAEFTGIVISNLDLIIVTMYHSPSGNFNRFFYLLNMCLGYLTTLGLSIVIGTDHNVNVLTHPNVANDFMNILRSYNIFFSVNEATHGDSPLDTILTNLDSWRYKAWVSVDKIADHKHVFFSQDLSGRRFDYGVQRPRRTISFRPILSDTNIQGFLSYITHHVQTWYKLLSLPDANLSFEYFFEKFKQAYDVFFPLMTKTCRSMTNGVCSVRPAPKDWYSPELARFKEHIVVVSDLSKSFPNLLPELRRLRREYRERIKEAKQSAVAASIMQSSNPCKAAWDHIKNRKATVTNFDKDFANADQFNTFFVESVSDLLANCKDGLPTNSFSDTDSLSAIPPTPSSFGWQPVSPEYVTTIVNNFKPSKSKDIYDMSVELLKKCINVLSPTIAFAINYALKKGIFPDSMKISRTVPVYKKGSKTAVSSYRPISIIPIFAKIFETVMLEQLYCYFEEHHLLVPTQFGFRRGMSTVQAVDFLTQEIMKAFEAKQSTSVILCDLSRAFDCVSHSLLLSKLERYGVRGDALSILRSYLIGRSQVVSWNGVNSAPLSVKYGVPQGSILGPSLIYCVNK